MCVAPSMMIGNQSSLMSVMGNRSVMKDQEEPAEREKSFDPSQPNDHPIMKLPSLSEKLLIMERGVLQNVYQEKQALYRGLPVLTGWLACVCVCTYVRMCYVQVHSVVFVVFLL